MATRFHCPDVGSRHMEDPDSNFWVTPELRTFTVTDRSTNVARNVEFVVTTVWLRWASINVLTAISEDGMMTFSARGSTQKQALWLLRQQIEG